MALEEISGGLGGGPLQSGERTLSLGVVFSGANRNTSHAAPKNQIWSTIVSASVVWLGHSPEQA